MKGSAPLPFVVRPEGDEIRVAVVDVDAFACVRVERLELAAPGAAGAAPARLQRVRTQLAGLILRVDQRAFDRHLATRVTALARAGFGQVRGRIGDGDLAFIARVTDGLATADLSFRVTALARGAAVRALAHTIRVHGHLPTPGPLLAHRLLELILGDSDGVRLRGLGDLELTAVAPVLWQLLPAAGWRLPRTAGVAVTALAIHRGAITVGFGAPGAPGTIDEPAASALARTIAVARDAMQSADELLRTGQLDDAMRGYRALLAAAGPDQPTLLERILAIAAARPAWFVDGIELARHALARWPEFGAAHGALASIALARGDSAEAAARLRAVSDGAHRQHDGDGAALAALAAARLLRVLDPTATSALYERVLGHWPEHDEAQAALIERLRDEERWRELVRALESRARAGGDPRRCAADWAQAAVALAEVLADADGARAAIAQASALDGEAPIVLDAVARVAAAAGELAPAVTAYAALARVATSRGDDATARRATIARAQLLVRHGDPTAAAAAWQDAVHAAGDDPAMLRGAARSAARVGDHRAAIGHLTRLLAIAGDDDQTYLELGTAHATLGDQAQAEAALGRAASGDGRPAAEALATLAGLRAVHDRPAAAAALARALAILDPVEAGTVGDDDGDPEPAARGAELALARALLVDEPQATFELQRAHRLAAGRAPALARSAAEGLLERATTAAEARRWIDAVLATGPEPAALGPLLLRRAELRLAADPHDLAGAEDDAAAAATASNGPDALRAALAMQARLAMRRGDALQAARALERRAEHARPVDAPADHVAAAETFLAAGDEATAMAHAERAADALGADDEPALAARVWTVLGDVAWRRRSLTEVARAYERRLATLPPLGLEERAIAELRLATACQRRGDSARAIELLATAAPALAGETRGQAYRLLADLSERSNQPQAAAIALEAFADAEDTHAAPAARADAYHRAGELWRRAGALDPAIRCLEAALRLVDDHLPALDGLELIERDRGDLDRVATILGRKVAATARQPTRQKALLGRLAAVHEQLGRPDVARATLARALELDAGYRPALRALADLARARGDRAELAELLSRLAASGDDDPEDSRDRIAAVVELAQVCFEDGEHGPAAPWRARALALCESLADDAGGHHAAVGQAADRLRAPAEPPVRPAATAPLPILPTTPEAPPPPAPTPTQPTAPAIDAALDPAARQAALEAAAADGDPAALRALADACGERGEWAAMARHLHALVEVPAERGGLAGHRLAELLLEVADLHYDHTGDVGRARASMWAAADAHGRSARRDATLRLLAAEAAAAADHAEAGHALEAIAAERRTAADVLALASAWRRAGHDARAIVVLEAAASHGRLTDDGAMILHALQQDRRRKGEQAASLERKAAETDPDHARQLLAEAVALYRDALDDEEAAARAAATLAALPAPAPSPLPFSRDARRRATHPTEMERLAEIAVQSGEMGAAADLFADAVAARARTSSGDLATVGGTLERLRAAVGAGGHPDALVRALFAAAAKAPPATALELYREAATTATVELQDELIALDALRRAHRLAPADGELVAAVADALEIQGDLAAVADVYERAAHATAGAERAAWLVTLARLQRDKLGEPWRARQSLDAAHAAAPELATVWLPLADARAADDDIPGARELYERAAAATGLDDALRTWAADRAAALARDPGVVAGVLGGDSGPAAAAVAAAALKAASKAVTEVEGGEGVGEPMLEDESFDSGLADARPPRRTNGTSDEDGQVVASRTPTPTPSPNPSPSPTSSAGTATVVGRVGRPLARITPARIPAAEAIAAASDDIDHERALRQGAELAQEGAVEMAIAAYERAARVAPAGDLRALTALELLHAQRGDSDGVAAAITRQIDATTDYRTRSRLWLRLAQIYRELPDREDDLRHALGEAHAAAPDDPDLAYSLRTIAMVHGEWPRAMALLECELAAATAPRDRAALHLEAALIFDERLKQPDLARQHYETALTLDPSIPAARRPLARLLEHAGAHEAACDRLVEAANEAPAADRPALLSRAAANASHIGQRERAVILAAAAADAALEVGNHEAAARAQNEALRYATTPARDHTRADEVAARAAELDQATASGDPAAIATAAAAVLAVAPAHPQAFAVRFARAEQAGDWSTAADLLAARATAEVDLGERARRYGELGRLHAERRNDATAARAAWERALEIDPGYGPALDALADLAYRQGDIVGASALYARVPVAASRLAPEAVLLRRAELAEAQGDDAGALALAQAAVRLAPTFAGHAAIARLAQKRADVDLAIGALRAGLDLAGDHGPEQVAARFELAELSRGAGDTLAAIYHHERVVAAEPQHARSLTALADLYVGHGNWAGAVGAIRALAALTGERERKAALLHRLGELHLDRQGDVTAADDAFLRASDVDPGHVPTLRRLLDVYWRADDPTALIEVARQLLEVQALLEPATGRPTLGRVMVAAAISLAVHLAARINEHLGADAAARVAAALAELVGKSGELELVTAALALTELARRGQGPSPGAIVAAAADLPAPAAIELGRAFGVGG